MCPFTLVPPVQNRVRFKPEYWPQYTSIYTFPSSQASFGLPLYFLLYFLKILFIFRERRREGERHRCGRETWISCLSSAPATSTCALARIEPVTVPLAEGHSTNWATMVRAWVAFLYSQSLPFRFYLHLQIWQSLICYLYSISIDLSF